MQGLSRSLKKLKKRKSLLCSWNQAVMICAFMHYRAGSIHSTVDKPQPWMEKWCLYGPMCSKQFFYPHPPPLLKPNRTTPRTHAARSKFWSFHQEDTKRTWTCQVKELDTSWCTYETTFPNVYALPFPLLITLTPNYWHSALQCCNRDVTCLFAFTVLASSFWQVCSISSFLSLGTPVFFLFSQFFLS